MKIKILDALKTRYAGVSETILDRVADRMAKTISTDEEVTTAVDGAFAQILEAYGDKRATDATKTAVQNYERKHGLKDGVKVDGGAPQDEPKQEPKQDDIPAWAQALVESNKKLSDRLAAIDGERTAKDRKGKLDEALKDLPDVLRKGYNRIDIAKMSDDEFSKMLDELPSEIAEAQKQVAGKQAVFGRPHAAQPSPGSGSKVEATDEELAALARKLNI